MRKREEITSRATVSPCGPDGTFMPWQRADANTPILQAILEVQLDIRDQLQKFVSVLEVLAEIGERMQQGFPLVAALRQDGGLAPIQGEEIKRPSPLTL